MIQFATRMNNLKGSAIRELLALANDWASGDDAHPDRVWTEESFANALKNESIIINNICS